MHYLHCVLVATKRTVKSPLTAQKIKNLKKAAKEVALYETEEFGNGYVFDWRSEGPGRWEGEVPDVILGAEDPQKMLEALEIWSQKPFEEAKRLFEAYIEPNFSQGLIIDKAFLEKTWGGESPEISWAIKNMMELLQGDYVTNSRFYSVPDESCKLSAETLKDVQEHPGKYALVFLDYHN